MATAEIRDLKNEKVGTMELAEVVFQAPVNHSLLHEAVRHYLACRRAGTHSTKGRGEVAGAGRKLWKQKGTGRARVGSIRSPLWRHGGTVHGPKPRDYSYKLPKKMVLGALRVALSAKLADEQLTIVDEFKLKDHKTKALREILNKFAETGTVLLVDTGGNENLELSSRNLPGVELMANNEVHAYHLLKYKRLLISRPALEKLQEALTP